MNRKSKYLAIGAASAFVTEAIVKGHFGCSYYDQPSHEPTANDIGQSIVEVVSGSAAGGIVNVEWQNHISGSLR